MYEELVKALRDSNCATKGMCGMCSKRDKPCIYRFASEAADAIEELQTTLCNWCAVCPEDKRDLSTCEIYESCRAKPPKEEK